VGVLRIVVVCTAGRCRSPLAAALMHDALAIRSAPAEIDAVGLLEPGLPALAETVAVAERRGLDLTDHRSRRLEAAFVAHADLVVAMERRHVQEVVAVDPAAWPRTFTLKELVRRGEAIGVREPGETLAAWIARAHEGRQSRELLGASELDDVADPAGSPIGEHEDLALELDDLTNRLADLIASAS
jgi:low molecular weight protein-tyrosine phosphatase